MLDAYPFESVSQVRGLSETWRGSYNRLRPHDSLGEVPPLTFSRGRCRRERLPSGCQPDRGALRFFTAVGQLLIRVSRLDVVSSGTRTMKRYPSLATS